MRSNNLMVDFAMENNDKIYRRIVCLFVAVVEFALCLHLRCPVSPTINRDSNNNVRMINKFV